MIKFVFLLIILEIIFAIWLISKLNKFSQCICSVSVAVKKSGFTGNPAYLRLALKKFNKQLFDFKQEKKIDSNIKIIRMFTNIILFAIPLIKFFCFKKKK